MSSTDDKPLFIYRQPLPDWGRHQRAASGRAAGRAVV